MEHHLSDLRALADRRKAGGIAETVKRAGAVVAGVAAGVIDLVRTEGLPKNLRDDYTAFSLATISYAMLYTTAAGLGEREVAELAQQHLRDYAGAVTRLNALVPASVIRYLSEEGLPVQESVLSEASAHDQGGLGRRSRRDRPRGRGCRRAGDLSDQRSEPVRARGRGSRWRPAPRRSACRWQ